MAVSPRADEPQEAPPPGMASFRTSTGINAAWRPSLAPWRSHVANLKGGPGEVVEVPAFLAFACNFDLAFVTPGFEWLTQPDLDELAEQRATAERYINPEHFDTKGNHE